MTGIDKGYSDTKDYMCVCCGKMVTLTKFASAKTAKCPECKESNAQIKQELVDKAISMNPTRSKMRAQSSAIGGNTKICKCIKCGIDTEVSKFMSADKAMCPSCKGVSSPKEVKGLAQRIIPDMSKLDRSKLLPIEEYETNEICIKNPRLRAVKCPACGHEYMKPNSIIDWSQFGLIISYQCPKCLLTMTVSEQCNRVIKFHSPGIQFDYTGNKIEEIGTSWKDQSRLINIIRKLIKTLDENNIKIDDDEIVPYRWKNQKPVPIGFEIPESDRLLKQLEIIADTLDNSDRQGSAVDMPEGSRYITLSDTLARKLSNDIRDLLKGDKNGSDEGEHTT